MGAITVRGRWGDVGVTYDGPGGFAPPIAPRLPPYSEEAEEATLAACLVSREAIRDLRGWLEPGDFYRGTYRDVYAAMLRLADRGEPTDYILVGEELGATRLAEIGGYAELGRIANQLPQSGHVEHYGRRVADLALLRRLARASEQLAALVYEPGARGEATLAAARDLVRRAGERANARDSVPFDRAVRDWLDGVYATMDAGPSGVLTGFNELDAITMGLLPTEMWLATAVTSGGKSVWALSVAVQLAKRLRANAEMGEGPTGAVEYITLEMAAKQQVQRCVAAWTGTNARVLRADFWDGKHFDEAGFHEVEGEALRLADAIRGHLRFYDMPLRLSQLEAQLERAVDERACPLAIVDYITLVGPENPRADERQKVNDLTWRMKQLAMRLRIPILCLMQMSRKYDDREDKRPRLTDLKNSSDAEQNADGVIGIHLPRLYDPARATPGGEGYDEAFARFGELWVLKARGSVRDAWAPFHYEGEFTRCSNWDRREWGIPDDPTRPGSGRR